MRQTGKGFKQSFAVFTLAMVLATQAFIDASAEKVLNRLDEPLILKLENIMHSKTTQIGEPFQARLAENHVYNEKVLPVNTLFKGKVLKVEPSRRFSRSAYVVLALDEAQLPNGEVISLAPVPGFPAETAKIHNSDPKDMQRLTRKGAPLTAASLGTSLPLGIASNMAGGVVYAITVGSRMTIGAVQGMFSKRVPNGPGPVGRFVEGAVYGSGVTPAWEFVTKDAEVDYTAGAFVPVQLPVDAMQRLYTSPALIVQSPTFPRATPASTGAGSVTPQPTPASEEQP